MGTSVDVIFTGPLGSINTSVADLSSIVSALTAQLDAAVSLGLSPLQVELAASLDASLSLQASLSLSVADPTASIRAALQAIIELQAALSAALSLPPLQLPSVDADISASAALAASLSARLGAIQLLIDAMLSVKLPALQLADVPVGAGPIVLLVFDGIGALPGSVGTMTLQEAGNKIKAAFDSGVGDSGNPDPDYFIQPTEFASGIIMVTSVSSAMVALSQIIKTV
jgi:hypothetical protein